MSYEKSTSPATYNRSERSFYGPGKFKWAIYLDHWKKVWGKRPMLGTVWADDEFFAVREAFNRGLCPTMDTSQLIAVKLNTPNTFSTFKKGRRPQTN